MQLITAENQEAHGRLLDSMFQDRKAVFVDLLKWDITHEDGRERDQFDNSDAGYLIVSEPGSLRHLASVRILRSDQPHLLQSLFPQLCKGAVPTGPDIREISRLCFSQHSRGSDRVLHRDLLASAMTEYALLTGIRGYSLVTDMSRMSNLLSFGWRCEPLGMPQNVSGRPIGALMIHIEADTIRRLKAAGRYQSRVLRIEEREDLAA